MQSSYVDIIDSVASIISEKINIISREFLEDCDLFDTLIERYLILKLIEDVVLPDVVCQQLLHNYLAKNNFSSVLDMEQSLEKEGIDKEKRYGEIYRVAKINLKALQMFKSEAQQKYHENIYDYTNIVYSFMRVSRKTAAQEFYFQIINGESSFSELASNFSEGFEKETNGLIGPVPLSQPHPILREKLRLSKPKEVIEPFYFGDKWIIAQLQNIKEIDFTPSVENKICMELLGSWTRTNVNSVKDALRMNSPKQHGS